MDLVSEGLEVGENFFGRLARVDIVAAGPQENHLRFIWKDDPLSEVRRIHDFRSAETAIDDVMVGEILCERVPHADGRGADEKHSAFGEWIGAVGLFEGGDFRFPFGVVMLD